MYSIGIDFGTLSGRAALVSLETGEIVAQCVKNYAHGVMDTQLPDGTPLPANWALQHPGDYLDVLETVVPGVMAQAGIRPEEVVGLGIDFTSSTVLPTDAQGMPLCLMPQWASEPHAWVKLWKHHGPLEQADRMTQIVQERNETFLNRYGGKVSSEWLMPKLLEMVEQAPEVYDAAHWILEAGDWLTLLLTGKLSRSSCFAGYKSFWHKQEGYPEPEFLRALNPRLEDLFSTKMEGSVLSLGQKAGELLPEMAEKLGLAPGTAVGVPAIDAHATVSAVGVTQPGELLMIIGTSSCDMLLGAEEQPVPGICGIVEDGMLPGLFGYEAGQNCVGDLFDWFVKRCVPASYMQEAEARGIGIHQLLTERAEQLKPGESGLLALDWWNGNRCILVDFNLTGLILGMTLTTKPEEIYRALIEATAFGKRVILENYEAHGVPIRRLYASGGISRKNRLLMQLYADITGKEIYVGTCDQAGALGSAIFGAAAAGKARGGYDTVKEAAAVMGKYDPEPYRPNPDHKAVYDALYQEFLRLHDYFGRGENNVMKRLQQLKQQVK